MAVRREVGGGAQLATYPFGADATSGGRGVVLSSTSRSRGAAGAQARGSTTRRSACASTTRGGRRSREPGAAVARRSNVTVTPWSAITSANYTSKVCNLTDVDGNVFDRTSSRSSSTRHCGGASSNTRTRRVPSSRARSACRPTHLVDFYVLDPDNGDDEYSNGDVLHLNFDMDTNRPACGGGASNASGAGGGKALVDCLFEFSHSLGADYEGEWATAAASPSGHRRHRRLGLGHRPATRATVVSTDVRNARGDALGPQLVGDAALMTTRRPTVDRFTVVVAANASNYTDGDAMVLHLDAFAKCPAVEGASSRARCVVDGRRRARSVGRAARRRGRQAVRRLSLWLLGDAGHRLLGRVGGWGVEPLRRRRRDDGVACFVIHLIDTRGGRRRAGARSPRRPSTCATSGRRRRAPSTAWAATSAAGCRRGK